MWGFDDLVAVAAEVGAEVVGDEEDDVFLRCVGLEEGKVNHCDEEGEQEL